MQHRPRGCFVSSGFSENKGLQEFLSLVGSQNLPQIDLILYFQLLKGYGFQRSGLKTGAEKDTFWSEIGSGLGEPGGTPPPRIPRSTPLDAKPTVSPSWSVYSARYNIPLPFAPRYLPATIHFPFRGQLCTSKTGSLSIGTENYEPFLRDPSPKCQSKTHLKVLRGSQKSKLC